MPFAAFSGGHHKGRTDAADELQRSFPGCRPINSERSVFDLPVLVGDSKQTILRISLPPNFPQDRPTLNVLVPVHSPAVDHAGRVHCRSLNEWNGMVPARSSLTAAVQEAVALLASASIHGPSPMGYTTSGAANPSSGQPMAGAAGGQGSGATSSMARQQLMGRQPAHSGPGYPASGGPHQGGGGNSGRESPSLVGTSASSLAPAPPPPPAPPPVDLDSLPTSELEKLLTDPEAMTEFLTKWLGATPAARALDEIQRQNLSLAQDNIAMQGAIEEARNHVAIVRSSEYAATRSAFDELCKRQAAVVSKLNPSALLEKLHAEVSQADDASGTLTEAFFNGSLSLEAFVDQYCNARTHYHMLDIKRQTAEQSVLAAHFPVM